VRLIGPTDTYLTDEVTIGAGGGVVFRITRGLSEPTLMPLVDQR
jgi:hypothetical protein